MAADKGDYEVLANIGHRIKGEGGSYGFDMISDLGDAIERSARTRNNASAREYAQELLGYLDSLEIVFD